MNRSILKKLLTSLLLSLFVGTVYAEPLDEEQARYAAAAFFSPSLTSTKLRAKGLKMKLRSKEHEGGFYIFDRPEGGSVFVADDDAIGRTVLGYTDQGSYDAENLPTGLRDWMDQITVLMDAVHEGKLSRDNVRRKVGQIIVNPLIKTQWNQYKPYYNLCPSINGERCITGCVATAMAQVMNYWKWPEHGYGSVTYTDEGCGQTLSQDFSQNYYDWHNMIPSYVNNNYTSAQALAVATLMRDCGYAVHMHYTPKESAAGVSARTMHNYFHYSAKATDRYDGNYSEDMWHEFIRQDLMAKHPILYSGQKKEEGHQFILDGYDNAGYYHVNWGWGGYQDGWFMLTNLNGYNSHQYMINHLVPEATESSDFSYTLEDGVLTINGTGMMPQEYAMNTSPWSAECEKIHKIIIGEGITGIVDYFGNGDSFNLRFSNLKEVILPEGLETIGELAFFYSPLESVQLPSSIVKMNNAFYGSNLKSLHLPANLEEYIDELPYCEQLTVDENNNFLCAEENILYSKNMKNLLFIPRKVSRIVIAENTQNICDYGIFYYGLPIISKCKKAPNLTDEIIQYSSEYIPNGGFIFIPCGSSGYDEWEKIIPASWNVLSYSDINLIPDFQFTWTVDNGTLTISGWGAQRSEDFGHDIAPYYKQLNSIKRLFVEEGVISLCWAAYSSYYNMTEVDLPSTLTSINSYCFAYAGLTSITCRSKQAPKLEENCFFELPNSGTLRVPAGSDYSTWMKVLPTGWNIEYFKQEPLATCYLYTGEEKEVFDMKEWRKLQLNYPNCVGIIRSGQEKWAHFASNMLIEDASVEGGYRCPYFVLTDLTYGYNSLSKVSLTGFYSPYNFTIMKGEYDRKLQMGHNTICLPFTISQNELPDKSQMYSYSHFDTDKCDVIFEPQTTIEAGRSCFVVCDTVSDWQLDLSGKIVTPLKEYESNEQVRGTYTTTTEYKGTGYAPRHNDDVFAPLGMYLHPFRACILINTTNASQEVHVRLQDKDGADYINSIEVNNNSNANNIYTLDGKRISSPTKRRPYIINGKIVIR